jgi:hypothetical protein
MKLISIFVLVWLAAAQAQHPAERLLDEVTTQKGSITLADLLPPDASQTSRLAAQAANLGRAPQPGSFRVFTSDQLRAVAPSGMLLDCPARVVVRRIGWPVDPATVKRILQSARLGEGLDLSQARIVVPDGVRTRTPNARLEAVNIIRTPTPTALTAQIECSDRSACRRFVVEILLSAPPVLANARGMRHAPAFWPEPSRATTAGSEGNATFLVQVGRRALLVTESNNLRITQTVFPLKMGRAGEIVRVTNPATRRVLVAEVVGPGLLRPAQAAAGMPVERVK